MPSLLPSIEFFGKGDHSCREMKFAYVRAWLCASGVEAQMGTDPKIKIFPRSNYHCDVIKRSATAFPSGPADMSPRLDSGLKCRRKEWSLQTAVREGETFLRLRSQSMLVGGETSASRAVQRLPLLGKFRGSGLLRGCWLVNERARPAGEPLAVSVSAADPLVSFLLHAPRHHQD